VPALNAARCSKEKNKGDLPLQIHQSMTTLAVHAGLLAHMNCSRCVPTLRRVPGDHHLQLLQNPTSVLASLLKLSAKEMPPAALKVEGRCWVVRHRVPQDRVLSWRAGHSGSGSWSRLRCAPTSPSRDWMLHQREHHSRTMWKRKKERKEGVQETAPIVVRRRGRASRR